MASNRLPVGYISGKQVSKSYSCSEKYEWHNLPFHKSEQPHHVATMKCPRHMSSRMGRYTASHGHGHSPEICGPINGFDEPGHLSSYNQGQDHACLDHTSEWGRHSISPGPGPVNSYRRKRSPSFGHVRCYAKGPNRDLRQAVSSRKMFSRHYHEGRYLPINADFPNGLFSEKDAAGHRSYMHSFHAYNKQDGHSWEDPISNISDRTSHAQLRRRDEVVRYRRKRRDHEFRAVHEVQLELSPNEDSREFVESNRKFRKAYNGNVLKRTCLKQGSHKRTYNGASASKYGRNSSQKRNADHLDGKQDRINVVYGDKSKRICSDWQDQQPLIKSEEMRNDIVEGNAETIKLEGPNGEKWHCNPKKSALAVPASNGSRKCDENSNMPSPKCSSKIVASLNTPNLSEGSKSMDLESDKESSVEGRPKRCIQHLPVTSLEKSVQPKGSGNLSEVRRDCLDLWRARRLRNNGVSETDKFLEADQQHSAQRGKVSTVGRVRNGRPATFTTSESDVDDIASESSDHFSSASSSERLQKCEERSNKKLVWDPSCSSIRKCDKSHRTATAEKGLIYGVELQPEANTAEVALQNEQDKLLCRQLSTDSKSQTHVTDINKVHAVVPHPDNGVPQNGFHWEADNDNSNERKKDILGVGCQNKKETGAETAEKTVSLCTGPTLLDQNNFATCPKNDILKENASDTPNHGRGITFDGSELDRGAVNKCLKRPIRSCESYCRDYKNWLYGTEPETMNCNISGKKQEYSALSDCANQVNQKATEDLHAPQTLGAGYQQISQNCTSDTANSGPSNRDDRVLYSPIPDLNCLPSMVADEGSDPSEEHVCVDEDSDPSEEPFCVDEGSDPSEEPICVDEDPVLFEEPVCVDEGSFPSEELVCQDATDGSKPQYVTKSLSDISTGPDIKEEQFKQAEPNQSVGEVCDKGTYESADRVQISDSNTGPPQLSTVEESSTSIDAFKIALCEFIKKILKPLCEDGLLTREVHKIIVKKAVEKVAAVWGSSAPSTETAINRVLAEESRNLYKLVQDAYAERLEYVVSENGKIHNVKLSFLSASDE
ncbi:hypothetical protein EJB05_05893 [Eragrostis curvula]|uniref:Uncharacterized protein n=1 Tax=Eragrostis curvula TaxID=38414 RepID=A0A5J9WGG4_9POAL|nr:hypothetical protein EJB05_05893 [Eragrostis curvula]